MDDWLTVSRVNQESIREFCLGLPHATERVQWGNDLLLCVGNKMFAVLALDAAAPYRLSFKCTPEEFTELIENEGIDPAPYVARYHWVALRRFDALSAAELQRLLSSSHEMVFSKLPRKIREGFAKPSPKKPSRKRRK